MHPLDATVVAVGTPPGRGGVGCLRLSGAAAHRIARLLFRAKGARESEPGGAPRFGRFVDRDGRPLDHGYLVLFPPDRAFTGEPTAELWTHGSPAVLGELTRAALGAGAVAAGPGEFTYRALRNGRLDLARAEAIRDLVASRTVFQARVAAAQAEGSLSRRLAPLREALADLLARGEAAVEFADEAEVHLPREALTSGIREAAAEARRLLAGFRTGRLVREGATAALTGMPNVGKSSLFNALLARERAIVSAVPGTTRDTLEESVDLDGIPLRVVDTAGLRPAADAVEAEGVRRARAAIDEADLVLLVLDVSRDPGPDECLALRLAVEEASPRTLIVANKSDLPAAGTLPEGAIRVSARTGEGLASLREAMRERLVGSELVEDPVLTDARHAEALGRASRGLEQALAAASAGVPEDLVLEDLREAMRHLGEITGEFDDEALYERIFSTFCIGK